MTSNVELTQTVPVENGHGKPQVPAGGLLNAIADLLAAKTAPAAAAAASAANSPLADLYVEQVKENRRLQAIVEKLFWEQKVENTNLRQRVETLDAQLARAYHELNEARAALSQGAQQKLEQAVEAFEQGSISDPASISPFFQPPHPVHHVPTGRF